MVVDSLVRGTFGCVQGDWYILCLTARKNERRRYIGFLDRKFFVGCRLSRGWCGRRGADSSYSSSLTWSSHTRWIHELEESTGAVVMATCASL